MSARGFRQALYGAVFVVGVPTLLVGWARATESAVRLNAVKLPIPGWVTFALGIVLLLAGMRELIVRGHGLPMNAFPPSAFVRSGVFRWLNNPIYIGFGIGCTGVALATGSAAGLWLVTPLTCLAMMALVHGYERHDLLRRFGASALVPPRLSIPRGDGVPTGAERAAVFIWIFAPWLILYYAVQALGRAPDAFGSQLPFERHWPVWQWTELLYCSAYLFIPLVPLMVQERRILRKFAVRSAVAIAIVNLIWVTIPVVAINRAFEPSTLAGQLLAFEQGASNGVAAFPAFHVLWTLLAADSLSSNARGLSHRAWATIAWIWAALISLSCLTTGMHTVIEVAAAVALWIPLRNLTAVWSALRNVTEHLANSWREWRVGPLRIINHSAYVAVAGGVGLLIAGAAAPEQLGALVLVAVCMIVGAGLYAQMVEGSSKLLRPFGWYGGVLGGLVALAAARVLGTPLVPLMAAVVLAAPWVQVIGRLRCLVQGCCHGGPTSAYLGIVYRHRRSRVTHIANLAEMPVHATPLYSIAGNMFIGVLLLRLRSVATPDTLLVGVYLMLSGIARFVEESFRAEPQTPTVAGLRSYQWLATGSLLLGVVCSALPGGQPSSQLALPNAPLLWAALGVALLSGCAMGVDFPSSNVRFSRLAPGD